MQALPLHASQPAPDGCDELARRLMLQPDVLAAWIFGSRVTGRDRPESDLDVAVLLAGGDDAVALNERRLELQTLLADGYPAAVDVVVLNLATSVLQHEVLAQGRRFFERDRAARVDFEVRAGQVYADLEPMRAMFRGALRRELAEGGLGGRR